MPRSYIFAIWLAAISNAGFGQVISAGVKAGLRTNGTLDPAAQNRDESRSYTVGPTIEVALPWKWHASLDALYRRVGDGSGGCVFTFCEFSRTRANIWEFPILAKRPFSLPGAMVYAGIGFSVRRVGEGHGQYVQVDYTIRRVERTLPGDETHGLVAAGGIEWSAWKIKVAPEFRYTRWNRRFWEDFGSRGFFTGSNPNQF